MLSSSQPAVDNGLTNVEVHPDEHHYRHDLKIKGKLQIRSADQLPAKLDMSVLGSYHLKDHNNQQSKMKYFMKRHLITFMSTFYFSW